MKVKRGYQKTIAEVTGYAEQTVSRLLKDYQEKGINDTIASKVIVFALHSMEENHAKLVEKVKKYKQSIC
jgi:phosphoribosylformylglycinamidine (FGAM) synthase PurS component